MMMTAELSGKCGGTCSCGHEACGAESKSCGGGCSCGHEHAGGCSCASEGDRECGRADGDSRKCCNGGKKHVAIAIDGPAGAGKTTLAKELSRRMGYVYVDTGAIYRAFAVHKLWLSKETAEKDHDAGPVTNETALNTFDLEFVYKDGEQIMMLWGENINPYLRTEQVSMESSNVATDPAVRSALLEFQRRQARSYDVVMEGRDIGTVVLPKADVKIYLTASLPARSLRRFKDLVEKGETADYCQVMEQLRARDWQDSTRQVAPLKPAGDAVELDNTDMTFDETVEAVVKIIQAKLG